jgi:hypothetical protein
MAIVKRFASIVFLLTLSVTAFGQPLGFVRPHRLSWVPLSGSFLEPNQFSTIWDFSRQEILLEAGYGQDVIRTERTIIGAEGLIWSGLNSISGFRFPVETADFFFGLYGVYAVPIAGWNYPLPVRVRLSHISSHLVDGTTDSTFGGSSSKYSREFISVESQIVPHDKSSWFAVSGGIKYVFHQVTKVEPAIQFPITVDLIPRFLPYQSYFFISASTTGSAYYPQYSAALTIRFYTTKETYLDLFGEYHTGATRFGVEGTQKENGYEFGIKLLRIPFEIMKESD